MLQYCFCFFGCKACEILVPQPGIEPTPLALEGEVLTTGPPGKSPKIWFLYCAYMSLLWICPILPGSTDSSELPQLSLLTYNTQPFTPQLQLTPSWVLSRHSPPFPSAPACAWGWTTRNEWWVIQSFELGFKQLGSVDPGAEEFLFKIEPWEEKKTVLTKEFRDNVSFILMCF